MMPEALAVEKPAMAAEQIAEGMDTLVWYAAYGTEAEQAFAQEWLRSFAQEWLRARA